MTSHFQAYRNWLRGLLPLCILIPALVASIEPSPDESISVEVAGNTYLLKAGDASLSRWLLPSPPNPYPNRSVAKTEALVALGRELFFDNNLSGNRTLSCGSCHQPQAAWTDGLPTALPQPQQSHPRATPSLINLAYNTIFLWDGRSASLEHQVLGPLMSPDEMNIELPDLLARLNNSSYRGSFAKIFGEGKITENMLTVAIASFERTLISRNTRFDQWVAGDNKAMTPAEVRGFGVFLDPDKGNCAVCHAAPNFTDNGFHNIGLPSFADVNADPGRYKIKPVKLMHGAFKTPLLRNTALTAPYFHDGSAQTLEDVVSHYEVGGEVKRNLSPELKDISLSANEKRELVAFLKALTEALPTSTHSAELAD